MLRPGGVLYATEVFNAGMYTSPACPATEEYWRAFNCYQRDLGGDPDVGAKLANLSLRAGFSDITHRYLTPQLDRRMGDIDQRREFMTMDKPAYERCTGIAGRTQDTRRSFRTNRE